MEYYNILSGGHCVSSWKWNVEPRQHLGYTLWYVVGGRGKLCYGDAEFTLGGGDTFLFDYGSRLCATQHDDDPLNILFADFCPSDASAVEGLPLCKYGGDSLIMPLLSRMRAAYESDNRLAFNAFLTAAICEYSIIPDEKAGVFDSTGVSELAELMNSAPSEQYEIDGLAKKYGYSTDHFIRLFSAQTGKTPYAYLLAVRLNKAKSLLRLSSLSVSDVAYQCGFKDIFSFSRYFRKKVGMSPSEYKNPAHTQNFGQV